jgi:hypothetical protein
MFAISMKSTLSLSFTFTLLIYSSFSFSAIEDARDFKESFLKKCVTDGEKKAVCRCAFDRWVDELGSTRSASALAAGRLLTLPENKSPSSSDISKGIRDMLKMGMSISACSSQMIKGNKEQDAFELARGIDQKMKKQAEQPNPNSTTRAQTQSVINDMLAKAISGQVGGGNVESDMKSTQHQQRNQAYLAREEKRPRLNQIKSKIRNSNPTKQPVSSYQDPHALNCELKGFSKKFCNCEWANLMTVLAGNDSGSARIAAAFVAVSTADLSDVDDKTQERAWKYLDSHRDLGERNCKK